MFSLSHFVISRSARATRVDLGHQLRLLHLVKIDDLGDAGPPRHQQQPGVIRVLNHQHAAERRSPRLTCRAQVVDEAPSGGVDEWHMNDTRTYWPPASRSSGWRACFLPRVGPK